MTNLQLSVTILGAVLIGALIPVLVTMSLALRTVGREVAAVSTQLLPTLKQVQVISGRLETLSRGLDGGDRHIANLLSAAGELSQSLERNIRIFNMSSAVVASVGPAVAAFIRAMRQSNETEIAAPTEGAASGGNNGG